MSPGRRAALIWFILALAAALYAWRGPAVTFSLRLLWMATLDGTIVFSALAALAFFYEWRADANERALVGAWLWVVAACLGCVPVMVDVAAGRNAVPFETGLWGPANCMLLATVPTGWFRWLRQRGHERERVGLWIPMLSALAIFGTMLYIMTEMTFSQYRTLATAIHGGSILLCALLFGLGRRERRGQALGLLVINALWFAPPNPVPLLVSFVAWWATLSQVGSRVWESLSRLDRYQQDAWFLGALLRAAQAGRGTTVVVVDGEGNLLPSFCSETIAQRGPLPKAQVEDPEPLATLSRGSSATSFVAQNPWTGRAGHFEVHSYLVRNRRNEVIGAAAFYHDRTEETVRAEQTAWRERLLAMGQTAAAAAHELRNPLMAASGFLQLLERDPHSPDAPRRWQVVHQELARITTLINRFLLLARPSRDAYTKFRLAELVRGSLALDQADWPSRVGLHIVVPENIAILGSPGRLLQVLRNLVANALEAVNGQGNIVIWAAQHGQDVWLAVENDGPHLTDEALAHLFEPFFSTKPKGVGLGLSLSRHIVEEHGGRLVAENFPGGVRFLIRLPAVGNASQAERNVGGDA